MMRLVSLLFGLAAISIVTASIAGGIYETPDGRLIERSFSPQSYPVPTLVVVCPSREEYLDGARKFAAYFLADKDIEIVDGRLTEPRGGATYVLLMHKDDPAPTDCVARFTDLSELHAEFTEKHTGQIDARVVNPGAKPGELLPTIASVSYKPSKECISVAAMVGLCARKGGLCESMLYESLFGLSPYLCGTGGLCNFLR